MKRDYIVGTIENKFPLILQESYDNCGITLEGAEEVTGVYCALDLTGAVIQAAKNNDCNMIVVHHPPIFNALKQLNGINAPEIISAANFGMTVYAAHTTADIADGGINDRLAKLFGFKDIAPMTENGLGRVGNIQAQTLYEFAGVVKATINDTHIKTVGDLKGVVARAAVVSGAGGDSELIDRAIDCGADVYITGDIRHHIAIYAKRRGIKLIEFGHFESENVFCTIMAEHLQTALGGNIKIIADGTQCGPFNKETV